MLSIAMLIAPLFSQTVSVEQFDILEGAVPGNWRPTENSQLSLSSKRFKFGAQSLRWDWQGTGAEIRIDEETLRQVIKEPRATFAIWVYNEIPRKGKLKFQFGVENRSDCSFDFGLDFQGWRTCWVMYHRDMAGKPTAEMNRLTIRAPEGVLSGTLYFDCIIYAHPVNPRHQMRDAQVPFVNPGADESANSHWMSLYKFSLMEPSLPLSEGVTPEAKAAFETITRRYEAEFLRQSTVTDDDVSELMEAYRYWQITRNEDGSITGLPVLLSHLGAIFPIEDKREWREALSRYDIKAYFQLMLEIAQAYRSASQKTQQMTLAQMFLDLSDHLYDQGWASGSGQGTLHHFGYSARNMYTAFFLMRDLLAENKRLTRSQQTMDWLSGAGKANIRLDDLNGINMDMLNTTITGQLASILIMPDSPEKLRNMQIFSRWLSEGLQYATGLEGSFKVDGSAFHHGAHYPAYAIGGFGGAALVTYLLSGTPFRIGEAGHSSLRKAIMTMRLYSNKLSWPLSLSGRHPNGEWKNLSEPFGYMALSGTPDGKHEIDAEAGSAYLRLNKLRKNNWFSQRLEENGIEAESPPQGHWTMNYATLSIHRRKHWLATARGHSRYFWAAEIYPGANMFGRYITFGHLEILYPEKEAGKINSGFRQDGWDWNRFAGTTTVHLPLEKLRADVKNVDDVSGIEEMLLSDEAFAGGIHNQAGNGIFAMKLHGPDKYGLGSLRAQKSIFFFDNRIVCLGSDIENEITDYPTETTLFQNHLAEKNQPIWCNSDEAVTAFPSRQSFDLAQAHWLLDNQKNGFYLPPGQTLQVNRVTQISRNQKDTRDTEGDFASAWISHGHAPQKGAYEYCILVDTDLKAMQQFAAAMQKPATASYEVLQQNSSAHIVRDLQSKTTGYVLFDAFDNAGAEELKAVSRASLLMLQDRGDRLSLSICDPDLRFYEGPADEVYDTEGRSVERSIYSRTWINDASKPAKVMVTLNGKWRPDQLPENCRLVSSDRDEIIVEFELKDGLSSHAVFQTNLKVEVVND